MKAGELVRVRSKEEILATLDADGRLDALPLMPEMLRHCGQTFRVYKRADRTCDTIARSGMRRMRDAVHLEGLRCDGSAHGGCQAGCLMFFKEAWLERVGAERAPSAAGARAGCTEAELMASVYRRDAPEGEVAYACQSTELRRATTPLSPWDLRQYARDIRSGNITAGQAARALFWRAFGATLRLRGYRLQIWLYTTIQRWRGGRRFPFPQGRLTKTPARRLHLQPGQTVRVREQDAIEATLDTECKNRGLSFDVAMTKHCGGTYKVGRRVERIIDERTGKMIRLPNDCLVLDGVVCDGEYHWACPRSITPYWREIWLDTVPP
jgi:hypothetical protein